MSPTNYKILAALIQHLTSDQSSRFAHIPRDIITYLIVPYLVYVIGRIARKRLENQFKICDMVDEHINPRTIQRSRLTADNTGKLILRTLDTVSHIHNGVIYTQKITTSANKHIAYVVGVLSNGKLVYCDRTTIKVDQIVVVDLAAEYGIAGFCEIRVDTRDNVFVMMTNAIHCYTTAGKLLTSFTTKAKVFTAAGLSNGQYVLAYRPNGVDLVSATGELIQTINPNCIAQTVRIDANDNIFIAQSNYSKELLWYNNTGHLVQTYNQSQIPIFDVCITHDGSLYAVTSNGIYMIYQSVTLVPIHVKNIAGRVITVYADLADQISTLKQLIENIEHIPISQQRLIFGGKALSDYHTLAYYNVRPNTLMHLILSISAD